MIHVTCDHCGKVIRPNQDRHYIVKLEVFAAHEPGGLTEEDLDADHLEAVSEMLCEMEETGEVESPPAGTQERRYDLCSGCRERFLLNPLGKEQAQKFDFSEN